MFGPFEIFYGWHFGIFRIALKTEFTQIQGTLDDLNNCKTGIEKAIEFLIVVKEGKCCSKISNPFEGINIRDPIEGVTFWKNPHILWRKIWKNTYFGAAGVKNFGKLPDFTKDFRFLKNMKILKHKIINVWVRLLIKTPNKCHIDIIFSVSRNIS